MNFYLYGEKYSEFVQLKICLACWIDIKFCLLSCKVELFMLIIPVVTIVPREQCNVRYRRVIITVVRTMCVVHYTFDSNLINFLCVRVFSNCCTRSNSLSSYGRCCLQWRLKFITLMAESTSVERRKWM
jgi:hypothetical protein